MDCSVHSPCGRYVVRYRNDGSTMNIEVVPKSPASESTEGAYYVAVLNGSQIAEISAAAGVRKEFGAFADMTYNALIGRSPCVRFFIETCEEMRERIATEVVKKQQRTAEDQGGTANADSNPNRGSGPLPESAQNQRFFTLDYDVDFTRAMFPVPLVLVEGESTVAITERQETRAFNTAIQQQRHYRGMAAAKCRTVGSAGVVSTDSKCNDVEKSVVAAVQEENDKLKRENSALTRLCRDKMLEMQKLCEDFKFGMEAVKEVERLKKKMQELRTRLARAEEERDEAQRALARTRRDYRSGTRNTTPKGTGEQCDKRASARRSRFDTPPVVRGHSLSRTAVWSLPAASHCSTGRKGTPSVQRNRSASSAGLSTTKRRLWNRCGSSGPPSRSSSRSSCERLYHSPTVSSNQRERCTVAHLASRAAYR
uniref:Uncharacterized protein n=1 Tax=Trypanosoma congolense (strain IL3000) TaxID=1068625 RepID=G0UV11_TRYCI|nr:conserved hypothetical protein [Trypanosoma congolense IL3000]